MSRDDHRDPSHAATPAEVRVLIEDGMGHHQAGRLAEAEARYRRAIAADPNNPDALHLLGVIAHQTGDATEAVRLIEDSVSRNPDNASALNNLGQAYEALGRADGAEDAYRRALSVAPGFPSALANLGQAVLAGGDAEAAIPLLEQALGADPDDAEVLSALGRALATTGHNDDALAHLIRAHELAPDDPVVESNLGIVLAADGRADDARAAFERALATDPDLAEAHYNLGVISQSQNRLDEAAGCYRRTIEIDRNRVSAHVSLSNVLAELGRLDEAGDCVRRALEIDPAYAEAHFLLAKLRTFEADDPEIKTMESLLQCGPTDADGRIHLGFALAKAWEDAGDFDKAFSHLAEANRLKRETLHHDPDDEAAFVARIVDAFGAGAFPEAPDPWPPDPPIFILGMPRSGTTLVEQILASHSQVFGAGERQTLRPLAADHGYPEGIAGLGAAACRDLGRQTDQDLRALAPGVRRITEKTPFNYHYIGLIRLALPDARIVHCARNPMDTCLSCFKELFANGQAYSYDLGALGRQYRSYRDLMAHWKGVLPGYIHDVVYEDLVADPEPVVRDLLSFVGLPWEDDCLLFHETARPVQTASLHQVRQPLYKTSVDKWRRYERHLAPLLEALGAPTEAD